MNEIIIIPIRLKIISNFYNIKTEIRCFWHRICIELGMETQFKSNEKTAEEICKEVETYLQDKTRNHIPSHEEFCAKYGHSLIDLGFMYPSSKELRIAIDKIRCQEIAMLKNFLILDSPEFTDSNGNNHKLDKKNIEKLLTMLLTSKKQNKKK